MGTLIPFTGSQSVNCGQILLDMQGLGISVLIPDFTRLTQGESGINTDISNP